MATNANTGTGTKRTHDTMNGKPTLSSDSTTSKPPSKHDNASNDSNSPYIPIFETFRAELDEHHDRRERVMKASKDITANSKKIIFALQRVKTLGKPIADKRILGDVDRLTKTIHELFTGIAPDLQGVDAYRYQRNISGGVQEYMEAVLFKYYLETQRMMDYEMAQDSIPAVEGADQTQRVMLTFEDYVLGLLDVTGELMRFAITTLATTGAVPGDGKESGSILADMQSLRSALEGVDVGRNYALSKDFEAKLKVTRQSVEKVENGVYGMIVRGKERPPGWTPDLSGPRDGDQIESY